MRPSPALVLAAVLGAACSHTRPHELTAEEHRAQSALHQQAAAEAAAGYDASQTRPAVAPRTPFADEGGPQFYNPTADHLTEADRQMRAALEHLQAAQLLEQYEDVACAGISLAERTACPVLAPFVVKVEELAQGLTLHLKPTAPVKTVAAQMQCHLAFAEARGFDRMPCPLYVKGVAITLAGAQAIDVRSTDPKVANEVRLEARRMFGEPSGAR